MERIRLKTEIEKLLLNADLNSITSKKIRLQLQDIFKKDLTNQKQEIDQIILEVLDAKKDNNKAESSSSSDFSDLDDVGPAPKKIKTNNKKTSKVKKKVSLSKPSASGSTFNNNTANSTSSSDSEMELEKPLKDEELAWKLHEEEGGRPRRSTAAQPKVKRKSVPKTDKPKRKSTGNKSTYSKSLHLSESLAAVVGSDSMPRHEVVKKMWEIAKERDLFDEKNKQFIVCDNQLEKLFGRKRIRMFGIMKHLSKHMWTTDE